MVQHSVEDYKTKALKRALQTEVSSALLQSKLQCKPIEGHDIPLGQLQKEIQSQLVGNSSAHLLEVEVIEKIENEISETDQLLSMLLPNQLRKATMQFLEVETLKSVGIAPPPKTKDQLAKESYEEVLKQDEIEQDISEEQREKTIKCLMKVLDYQLQGVKE